jgi:hypothetical protein
VKAGKARRTINNWPTDFYISEIVDGLHQLKEMKDANKRSTLVDNFHTVFGLKYHKTSFSKYKGLMDTNDTILQDTIEDFVSRGAAADALWPKFMEAIKDRVAVLAKEKDKPHHRNQKQREQRDLIISDGCADNSDSDSEPSNDDSVQLYLTDKDQDIGWDSDDNWGDDIPNSDDLRCAYCDEKLPASPTQQLTDMGLALEKISVPRPLPANPNHRRISSFTKHQDYCARHHLETEDMPLARLEKIRTSHSFTTAFSIFDPNSVPSLISRL